MWCPICRKELDVNSTNCPECGSRLKKNPPDSTLVEWVLSIKDKLTDDWPYFENGEPEKAIFLAHYSSVNMEDMLIINKLTAYGIPLIKTHPETGSVGKIILGISGFGTDIYVPESLLEDAKALLEDTADD